MSKDLFCPRKVTIIVFLFLAVSSIIILYGQEKSKKPQVSFEVNVKLKLFDVLALDEDDKLVKDLKKEDFELFIDGKPWPIQTFDVKEFGTQQETEKNATAVQSKYNAVTDDFFDKRLSIFVFHELRVLKKPREQMAKAVFDFLDKKFTKDDLVAIYYMKGSTVLMLQPFTDDKQLLKDVIQKALVDGEYKIRFNWSTSSLYIPIMTNEGRIVGMPIKGNLIEPWSAGNIEDFKGEQQRLHGIKAGTALVTNFHVLINSLALFKGRKEVYLISDAIPSSYYGSQLYPSPLAFNNFKKLTIDARNNNITINALDMRKHSYQFQMGIPGVPDSDITTSYSYVGTMAVWNEFLIGLAGMTDGEYYPYCNRKDEITDSLIEISEKSSNVYYLGAYIQDLEPEEKYDIEIKAKREDVKLIYHDIFRTKPEYEEMDDIDRNIHFLEALYGSYVLKDYPFKSEILQFPYEKYLTFTITIFKPETFEKSSSKYDAAVRYYNVDTKNDSQEFQIWDVNDYPIKNNIQKLQMLLGAFVVDDEYIYRHVLRDSDSGAISNSRGIVKLGLSGKLLSSIVVLMEEPSVLSLTNLLNRKEMSEESSDEEKKEPELVFNPAFNPLVYNDRLLTFSVDCPVDSSKPVFIMYMINQEKITENAYDITTSIWNEKGELIYYFPRNVFPETEFPGGWKRITLVIPENTFTQSGGKYTFRIAITDDNENIVDTQERMIVTK